MCAAAGTFHSNLPKIVQTLRFSLLHKDKRTFADASDQKADWWAPLLPSGCTPQCLPFLAV